MRKRIMYFVAVITMVACIAMVLYIVAGHPGVLGLVPNPGSGAP